MNKLRIKTLSAQLGGTMFDQIQHDGFDEWSSGGGSGGPCTISSCTTTYTGPTGIECCCFYSCPSGSLWKCTSGYCAA